MPTISASKCARREGAGGRNLLDPGLYPAKTWLQAAHVFSVVKKSSEFGVNSSEPTVDWQSGARPQEQRRNGLVNGLSGSAQGPACDVDQRLRHSQGRRRRRALADLGAPTVEAANVILATGLGAPQHPRLRHRRRAHRHQRSRPRLGRAAAARCHHRRRRHRLRVRLAAGDFGSEVHIFEALDQLLPGMDPMRSSRWSGRCARRRSRSTPRPWWASRDVDERRHINYGDKSVEVDVVLMAVGRGPRTENVGLETPPPSSTAALSRSTSHHADRRTEAVRSWRHRRRHAAAGPRRLCRGHFGHHVHRHRCALPRWTTGPSRSLSTRIPRWPRWA